MLIEVFPYFMDLASGPYPEVPQFTPHPHNLLCKVIAFFTSHLPLHLPTGFLLSVLETNVSNRKIARKLRKVPVMFKAVPLDVQLNFGCQIIADKRRFMNNFI